MHTALTIQSLRYVIKKKIYIYYMGQIKYFKINLCICIYHICILINSLNIFIMYVSMTTVS